MIGHLGFLTVAKYLAGQIFYATPFSLNHVPSTTVTSSDICTTEPENERYNVQKKSQKV